MKINLFKTALLFSLMITTFGCTHNEIQDQIIVTESQLIGEWRSSNTLINGKPIQDYQVGYTFEVSNIFGLKADGVYYFNYNSGDWKLENNTILLENERDLKILKFENGVLTLEAEIFESQTFVDLEGIESNEKVTIQEDFRKE